jgi:hypothetical protein
VKSPEALTSTMSRQDDPAVGATEWYHQGFLEWFQQAERLGTPGNQRMWKMAAKQMLTNST